MKGVQFSMEGTRKRFLINQHWYIKGKALDLGEDPAPYKTLLSAPSPSLPGRQKISLLSEYDLVGLPACYFLTTITNDNK